MDASIVDYVEQEDAIAMFKANPGIAWIKTRIRDGVRYETAVTMFEASPELALARLKTNQAFALIKDRGRNGDGVICMLGRNGETQWD